MRLLFCQLIKADLSIDSQEQVSHGHIPRSELTAAALYRKTYTFYTWHKSCKKQYITLKCTTKCDENLINFYTFIIKNTHL
jgi:hypothetical protein